jgi:ATP-dependent DNA helicase DinG
MEQTALAQIFGAAGRLAEGHGRFEHREDQDRMAQAVAAALRDGGRLVVEAGTGTGKTLAYLIPTLLGEGPVVIATGTKALQDQIVERELPIAMQAIGRTRRVEVLKGRDNYLCRKRLEEADAQPILDERAELPLLRAVRQWAAHTLTGDRSEITDLPDRSPLWSRLNARQEICIGQDCPHFQECHLYVARRRAQSAHVIVTNHHLLFSDLALRRGGYGQVLPDARAVILDEAHLAEDAAASHFGARLSQRMVVELARDGAAELTRAERHAGPAKDLERQARTVFAALRPDTVERGRVGFDPDRVPDLARLSEKLRSAWGKLEHALGGPGSRSEERALLAGRCRQQQEVFDDLLEGSSGERVVTLEAQGRSGAGIVAWPIEVGPLLEETLGAGYDTIVATSATLAVAGKLDRASSRLGVPEAAPLILPSPFDHRQQAALYIPKRFPEPREASFPERCREEILRLLEVTEGKALLLFASHRALEAAAQSLRGALDWPVLVQGEAPRERLVERFRDEVHSVLLGTASFRQGIDVPGEALSLVVVDKLPFAVPDDPVVAARAQVIRDRGGSPFMEDQLPEAILALKQAFGRLLRSRTDRGLLALLDVRVRTRRYGDLVLRSLPPWPVLDDVTAARRWFER